MFSVLAARASRLGCELKCRLLRRGETAPNSTNIFSFARNDSTSTNWSDDGLEGEYNHWEAIRIPIWVCNRVD